MRPESSDARRAIEHRPARDNVVGIITISASEKPMSSVEKISIALPPEMVAQLRHAVETGEYASSSEVVRDALRDWSHKRQLQQNGIAELRQIWQQALADERPGVPADQVFDALERKYQAMADRADTGK